MPSETRLANIHGQPTPPQFADARQLDISAVKIMQHEPAETAEDKSAPDRVRTNVHLFHIAPSTVSNHHECGPAGTSALTATATAAKSIHQATRVVETSSHRGYLAAVTERTTWAERRRRGEKGLQGDTVHRLYDSIAAPAAGSRRLLGCQQQWRRVCVRQPGMCVRRRA